MLLTALLLTGGAIYVFISPSFRIEKINIAGNNRLTDEEILDIVPFARGDHILFLRAKLARKMLSADEKVAWVEIHRRLPDNVDIIIEELHPVLLLSSGRIWGLDETGRALPIDNPYEIPNLPFLSGIGGDAPPVPYEKIESEFVTRGLIFLGQVQEAAPQFIDKISEIIVQENNIRVVLTGDGLVADIGGDDCSKRILRLKAIIDDLGNRRAEVRSIDLRYSDQAIVHFAKNNNRDLRGEKCRKYM